MSSRALTVSQTLTAAALAGLLLTACGSEDAPSPQGGVATVEASPTSPSGSASASASPSQPADASPTPGEESPLLAAARTASEALPVATVVSIEDEDDEIRGWEAEVVRPNGEVVGLVIAPEGGRVTLGPSPSEGDEELVELSRQAQVTVVEALEAAVATAPEGVLESVQLEDEDGTPIWQVDLVDAGGVRVDAVTGEATPDD